MKETIAITICIVSLIASLVYVMDLQADYEHHKLEVINKAVSQGNVLVID